MAKIKFENGVTVNFEGNPTQQDIDEIATKVGIQKQSPKEGVFKSIKSDVGSRWNEAKENAKKLKGGEINLAEYVARNAGQGIGVLTDVATDVIEPVATPVIKTAVKLSPVGMAYNNMPDEVKNIIQEGLVSGIQKGSEVYNKIPERYRKDIEGIVNVLSVLPAGKLTELGIKGTGVIGKGTLKIGAKGLKETGKVAGSLAETATSLGTGMERKTIQEIMKAPEKFSSKAMEGVDRNSIFEKVRKSVDKRLDDLSDTGKIYDEFKKDIVTKVSIPKKSISEVLDNFGIKLNKAGKIIHTEESSPMSAGDISQIQGWIDKYGKNELKSVRAFLNARNATGKIANFASGTTDTASSIGKKLYAKLNEIGRSQVKGLEDIDKTFSPEKKLLKRAKKTIYDREGNIKGNAMSIIANLTGKGKEQILPVIEKIVPGISKDVDVLKAIQDIEKAKGVKVGTYARGTVAGGGLVTGNIPAVIAAIASAPQVAVPMIRALAKTKKGATELVDFIKSLKK